MLLIAVSMAQQSASQPDDGVPKPEAEAILAGTHPDSAEAATAQTIGAFIDDMQQLHLSTPGLLMPPNLSYYLPPPTETQTDPTVSDMNSFDEIAGMSDAILQQMLLESQQQGQEQPVPSLTSPYITDLQFQAMMDDPVPFLTSPPPPTEQMIFDAQAAQAFEEALSSQLSSRQMSPLDDRMGMTESHHSASPHRPSPHRHKSKHRSKDLGFSADRQIQAAGTAQSRLVRRVSEINQVADVMGMPLRVEMNSDSSHTVYQVNTPEGLVTMVRLTRKNETTRNTVLCCRLPLKPMQNARMVRIDLIENEVIVSHPQLEINMPFLESKEPGLFWAKLDTHIFNSSSKGSKGFWQSQRRKTLFLLYSGSLWGVPIYIVPRGAIDVKQSLSFSQYFSSDLSGESHYSLTGFKDDAMRTLLQKFYSEIATVRV